MGFGCFIDLKPEVRSRLIKRDNISKSGYKLLFNVERGGGQVIFHVHLHLIGGGSGF